jgi:N,N'-diacetyllegionaminate synthase
MGNPTLIIAEAGVNHNGDLGLAKELVDVAAEAGADLVKFQTFNTRSLVTSSAAKAQYQLHYDESEQCQSSMLQTLELTAEMHKQLILHCEKRGIGFFSTAFDIQSLDYLAALDAERFKIPSGEITNLPYLRHASTFGKPIILSTGMATLGEIETAIDVLTRGGVKLDDITVLHCTTEYPAPMCDVNLLAMISIRDAFQVAVGYSDHTLGIEVPIAAVGLGATVIEKHLTLNRRLRGPDHTASLEPLEFASMVNAIRNIETALGDGIKRPVKSEIENKLVIRKSLVAGRFIKAGELFTADNLSVKRPGNGISPMLWDQIIGRVARRDFDEDELIEF